MSTQPWTATLEYSPGAIGLALGGADRRFVGAVVVGPVAEGYDNRIYRTRDCDGVEWVVRVPKREYPREVEQFVRQVTAEVSVGLGLYVPVVELVARLEDGNEVTVVRPAPGVVVQDLLQQGGLDVAAFGRSAGEVVRRIHMLRPPSAPRPWPNLYPGMVTRALERLEIAQAGLEAEEVRELKRWLEVTEWLHPPGPLVFSHDDFWPGNLFADPGSGELTGVIDWSDCRMGFRSSDFLENAFQMGDGFLDAAMDAYQAWDGEELAGMIRRYAMTFGPMLIAAALKGSPGARAEYFAGCLRARLEEGWLR